MTATAGIGTIAVHLPTAGLCERLLDAAVPLARAHNAVLVGVHVVPAVVVYADATVSMSTEFIVAQQQAFQDDAEGVEKAFRARVEREGVAFEWSLSDTGEEPTMRAASTACNSADLVVASQYHESIPASSGYSPDELVLGTGRPVLVVPVAGALPQTIGRRVVAAWNGSREASRSTFDCLPLLQADAELHLVTVDSARGSASIGPMSRTLERHGVTVRAVSLSKSDGRSTADEIFHYAEGFGADLLVVGCYGHSRLMETVFGGATTRILRGMTLPVLMAH